MLQRWGLCDAPFIIFDRKNLKVEMTSGEVLGTMYGTSDNGWIDGELFSLWFHHHFLIHAPPARPLLLLLNGHSSHYTFSVVEKAAQEGVILFCLLTVVFHLTQCMSASLLIVAVFHL